MASATSGKEVPPALAAVTVVVALLVIVGLGWYFGLRGSREETGKKPSQPPRLPASMQPPSGGPMANPNTSR